MSLEDCVAAVRESRKYSHICQETLCRVVGEAYSKYPSDKAVVKAAKTRLHQMSAMFIGGGALEQANRLLDELTPENAAQTLPKLLALHTSSRERLGHGEALLRDVTAVTGLGPVWDIACGFHPFLAAQCGFADYTATDIDLALVALIGRYFTAMGIPGRAFPNDILYETPPLSPHNVFLFKLAPLLEQQRKGSFSALIRRLPAMFYTVTFPSRSVSGKNVGMREHYRAFMEQALPREAYAYCLEREYDNELLFVLQKR